MATLRQTAGHMTQFAIGRVIFLFVLKVWMPFTDFFRRLWWKAWGYDPKADPSYHLSQIDFTSGALARNIIIGSMALDFLTRFYNATQDDVMAGSKTLVLLSKRMNYRYIDYDTAYELQAIFEEKKPAAKLFEFILEHEGIAIGTFDYRMANNLSFREFIDTALEREVPLPA